MRPRIIKILAGSLLVGLAATLLSPWLTLLPFIDAIFGIAFWVADTLGAWRPGPSWPERHRAIAVFCVLVWPFLASTSLAIATTLAWHEVVRKRQVSVWAAAAFMTVLALVLGFASLAMEVSWRAYLNSNY